MRTAAVVVLKAEKIQNDTRYEVVDRNWKHNGPTWPGDAFSIISVLSLYYRHSITASRLTNLRLINTLSFPSVQITLTYSNRLVPRQWIPLLEPQKVPYTISK